MSDPLDRATGAVGHATGVGGASAGQLRVRRVFNNSAVLVEDEAGDERVLLGKGIGFHRRPGDPVDTTAVDKTFTLTSNELVERYLPLIAELPAEEIDILQQIQDEADDALGRPVPPSALLPLADHLNYAIRRARDAEPAIEYDLKWEVRSLYPEEVAFSKRVLAIVTERTGIGLPPTEVTPLALHFANSRLTSPDIGSTMLLTKVLGRILTLVKSDLDLDIEDSSLEVARLVSHLRYLTSGEGHQLAPLSSSVYDAVRSSQPQEYAIAQKVGMILTEELGLHVREQEIVFLTLHITRLRVATQYRVITNSESHDHEEETA